MKFKTRRTRLLTSLLLADLLSACEDRTLSPPNILITGRYQQQFGHEANN